MNNASRRETNAASAGRQQPGRVDIHARVHLGVHLRIGVVIDRRGDRENQRDVELNAFAIAVRLVQGRKKIMTRITLWQTVGNDWNPMTITGPARFNREGREAVAGEPVALITPISPLGANCAVVLVPDELTGICHSGVSLATGLHLLQHGDHLDFTGGTRIWISVDSRVDETLFDPAVHGEDVFCFRTKARISPGEKIVICPGIPGAACGMIYRADAWQQVGLACHNCTFDPSKPLWKPPTTHDGSSLDDLYELVARLPG